MVYPIPSISARAFQFVEQKCLAVLGVILRVVFNLRMASSYSSSSFLTCVVLLMDASFRRIAGIENRATRRRDRFVTNVEKWNHCWISSRCIILDTFSYQQIESESVSNTLSSAEILFIL